MIDWALAYQTLTAEMKIDYAINKIIPLPTVIIIKKSKYLIIRALIMDAIVKAHIIQR